MRRVTKLHEIKQVQLEIENRDNSFIEWLTGKRKAQPEEEIIEPEEEIIEVIEIIEESAPHHNINCNCNVFIHLITIVKDLFTPCCKPE